MINNFVNQYYKTRGVLLIAIWLLTHGPMWAQKQIEPIPYGDFNQWKVRIIKESLVLGGNTQTVYAVAPTDTVKGAEPYKPAKNVPWGCSNALGNVAGIIKTSTTVFPEKRESGYCARLETKTVVCKVLGMFNIKVLASGSLFLGETVEPIRNANNPMSKINMGIPFKKRPIGMMVDYKAKISDDDFVTKANIFSITQVPGRDRAQMYVLLQNRSEDAEGNITARRVATGKIYIERSTTNWVNDFYLPILYGDITSHPDFKSYMKLIPESESYYSKNSKGEMTPVHEIGWADKDAPVTHLILMLSSGSWGAYIGSLGNTLWVDNIRLVYE